MDWMKMVIFVFQRTQSEREKCSEWKREKNVSEEAGVIAKLDFNNLSTAQEWILSQNE